MTLALLLVVLVTGCDYAQTPFVRSAGEIGSTLAASALTIEYAHTGKMPEQYASASLLIYREKLASSAPSLGSLGGAPGQPSLDRLMALLEQARTAVAHPCLGSDCDWQAQVATIRQASGAFVQASQ